MKLMKKLIYFTFFLLFFYTSTIVKGQAPSKPLLDEASFKKIISNQFLNIITGQNKNTIGNFGAVDIKDASLALNASKIVKNRKVFSINVNAGISDGISSIFSNSKLNSEVGIQVRYSMIRPYSEKVTYILSSIEKRDFEISKKTAVANAEKAQLNTKKIMVNSLINLLAEDIKDLRQQLPAAAHADSIRLNFQVEYKNYQIDSLKIISAKEFSDLRQAGKSIDDELKAFRKKAEQDIPEITGFSFGWFNLVYKVNSQSFRLFDTSVAFKDQVKKDNYVSHKAGVEYNYYNWSTHAGKSWFLSIGAALEVNNNLTSLTKTELNETTNYTTNPGQRASTKKYNVYTGVYQKELLGISFYTDFYKFIFDNNNAAFHLYPQLKLQKNEKPVYSFGLGFMVAFKDQKDEKSKSIVNAELYANFLDLTNTASSDKKLLERNDIGLRLAFPIKFFYQ